MLKTLRYRAYAGVVGAILQIPWIYLEFLRGAKRLSGNILYIYYPLLVIEIVLYSYFMWGFKIVGDKTKNKLLSISTVVSIIAFIAAIGSSFILQNQTTRIQLILSLITLILVGGTCIPVGISLIKLKNKFGSLAQATGILNIITGVCLVTIIFVLIALLIYIPQTAL